MKKSAFSVFNSKGHSEKRGKKEDMQPPETLSNLKRAGSTPTMGRGKKLLNSIRASVRGSGQKKVPPSLKSRDQSPHVASDTGRQVSLTSLNTIGDADRRKKSENPNAKNGGHKPAVNRATKPSLSNLRTLVPARTSSNASTVSTASRASKVAADSKPPVSTQGSGSASKASKRQLDLKASPPSAKKKRLSSESSSGKDGQKGSPTATVDGESAPEEKVSRRVPYMFDSSAEASTLFDVLIHPVTADRFFSELWEQKPLLVRRHIADYNAGWFSTAEMDKILRQEDIQFGVNIDITSYVNDKRETHNPVGRAYAPLVWDFYQRGCSVRFLNPQTYSRTVWKLLSSLQEFFNCSVGANVYLTPPGTQGFAPHYDDIEAFIIQLEGKKHWKLYNPRSKEETLPRFSSNNFSKDEIGAPILDVVLEAGDLLYFPRGTIHQASATEDDHSMHVTFSCYQRNTWADLMEKLVPQALAMAIEENEEMRKGLPRDYLHYMGIVHQDKTGSQRQQFEKKVEQLVTSLLDYLPLDAACDQMGKRAIHDALPPVLTKREKACSVHGAGEYWDPGEQQVRGVVELEPDTAVRIMRRGVIRMLTEEDEVRIYHTLENSRVYHGNSPQYIEISSEMAPAVEYLIDVYPEYVPVDALPLDSLQEKLDLASTLYDKGLLVTQRPLKTTYDEGHSSEEEEKDGEPN